MLEKLRQFIEDNYEEDIQYLHYCGSAQAMSSAPILNYEECFEEEPVLEETQRKSRTREKYSTNKKSSIEQYIEENNDNNHFQTLLFNHIDSRNLKDSDVYNKVHIDRRLFSKIRSDKYYHPSKETIILLGISLELNEKEIEELLQSASYYLPNNNYFDLIIRFCFRNKIYNIDDINNYLEQYNCKQFNY